MFRIFSFIKSVILWSYERGTWQYDTLVVLILAFLFFAPNRWFQQGKALKWKNPGVAIIDAPDAGMKWAEVPVSRLEGREISEPVEKKLEEYLRSEGFNIERVEKYEIVPAKEQSVGELYRAYVRFAPITPGTQSK